MTLLPTENRQVVGLAGEDYPPYKVPPTCAKPGCTHWTDHAHHLFSRGKMGGAYDYVRLEDGTEVGNLIPLCFGCHERVTDNVVRIVYNNGKFFWEGQPLTWQPPVLKHVPDVDAILEDAKKDNEHRCPACHRLIPRAKTEAELAEPKKTRKTWAVAVPYTAEENGADTLDALLDAARDEMDRFGLDWGDGHKVKFYVLSTALALFVQHATAILNDE